MVCEDCEGCEGCEGCGDWEGCEGGCEGCEDCEDARMRGCDEDGKGCEGCEDCPCQWTEVDGLVCWRVGVVDAAVGWGVLLRRRGWLGFWRWLPGSSQRCAFLVEAEPAGPASIRK